MTTRLPFAFITSNQNIMKEINGLTHVIQSAAVYDFGGYLVRESLRTNGVNGDLIVNKSPKRLSKLQKLKIILKAVYKKQLYVNTFYCGPHFFQFGHFLTETLTRIPISQKQIKQVLFHSYDGDHNYSKIIKYQKELLDLLNIVNVKIIDSPAVVINLKVQHENVVLNGSINESAVAVWRSIVKNTKIVPQKTNTKIFLSRSKIDKSLKRVNESYEAHYEDNFQQKGFEIIYPEYLSINEQINIINSAQTIAGFSGSALHLSIFSEPGTKIIELGDKRSPQTPNTHQINICKALGLIHEFHSYEVSMKTII